MKLNHFKFQDGKVFWLPEYPEKPEYCVKMDDKNIEIRSYCSIVGCQCAVKAEQYDKAVAKSIALAIEVAPEDALHIEKLIWFQFPDDQNNPSTWQPENGKVYSAECEMETFDLYNTSPHQVTRLKPIKQ